MLALDSGIVSGKRVGIGFGSVLGLNLVLISVYPPSLLPTGMALVLVLQLTMPMDLVLALLLSNYSSIVMISLALV